MNEFALASLLHAAIRLQWPAFTLASALLVIAFAHKCELIPTRISAVAEWLTGAEMLIAWPVYLWGSTAAYHCYLMFYELASCGLNRPMGLFWASDYWATAFSQFLALGATMLASGIAVQLVNPIVAARKLSGPLWAIAAVAFDYLFFLLMVTPVGGSG